MGRLITALQVLPGVGPKTATRIALHLVHKNRAEGRQLADALFDAVENVRSCQRCRNISDSQLCDLCANPRRDSTVLCVVESPTDAFAIEQSGSYSGRYFVLHGHLSPIDGVGPKELGMGELKQNVVEHQVEEVIVATGTTTEGEATAHYIASMLSAQPVTVSRIAHGVPVGGELSYSDVMTINHALRGRTTVAVE